MKKRLVLIFAVICVVVLACLWGSCGTKQGTEGLEYDELPDGTYGVREGTTGECKKIVIPESVTVVNTNAFYGFYNLTEIYNYSNKNLSYLQESIPQCQIIDMK